MPSSSRTIRARPSSTKASKTTSDGTAIVNAEIGQPQGEPIKLDFIVQTTGQGLKVIDVKVEGVSLLVTKRSEFNSVVAQKGIDGLIQAMRQKVSEEFELSTLCRRGARAMRYRTLAIEGSE